MQESRRVKFFKDPASAWTHFAGFWAAMVGLLFLIIQAPPESAKLASFVFYGICLAVLFLASSCYHFFDIGERGNHMLRRVDHAAIYWLIVGTYVPPVVHLLDGAWRTNMLIVLFVIGTMGSLYKLIWFKAPVWLDVMVYVGLGWMIFIPGDRIWAAMDTYTFAWMLIGGLFYTVGAVVFATEWPDPWPKKFGHHDVWHLFVLAGAACHFYFVYLFLPVPIP